MSAGEEIWQEIQTIVSTNTDSFRVSMNSNVHCMDVGIRALKASDPTIDYDLKEKIHRLFEKAFFTFNSLEAAILHSRDTENIDRVCFVKDPHLGQYIVGPSYATLQKRVATVLKSSTVTSAFTGTDSSGKTTVNIGHLSLKESSAATTPLEAKLKRLLHIVQSTPIAASLVSSKLNELHKHHLLGAKYLFNRKNFDIQSLESILGTGTVFVTLQTTAKNKALAALEGKIELDLRKYLTSEKFHKALLRLHGSNTILEDIAAGLRAAILGDKRKISGSIHTPKPPKTSQTSLLTKKTVSSSSLPQLRSTKGQFTSLLTLQNLINMHLPHVIAANMGEGRRRDILNYRTGRFATTVQVEKMSQSREGMITAFYSYMKNPYATFSEGGRQQYPRTRDPKLLISKSIREIAATHVANRMRAVAL